MRPALTSFTRTLAATAALAVIERLLPAFAAGLVAIAHELHPGSARAEMERRER